IIGKDVCKAIQEFFVNRRGGGMTSAEQSIILNIIPFAIGKLPAKYLGVPLITKKINATDCKPLIEKDKNRVLD
nr:RNA-directed DNA polymerase, eukaryota, reverse transcriptase zinc-binding domain protein [Tanacetum cinerariifolium]